MCIFSVAEIAEITREQVEIFEKLLTVRRSCGKIYEYRKIMHADVMELADVTDSKSVGLITRAGSTPATGTKR